MNELSSKQANTQEAALIIAEAARKKRNKRIAYVLGAVALVWYVLSMFTIWNL